MLHTTFVYTNRRNRAVKMTELREFRKCTVRCGVYAVENIRLRVSDIELAMQGDAQAQASITKKFVTHLRELGVFSSDENTNVTVTYDMLRIDIKKGAD